MLKINVTTAEAVVTETELITAGRKGLRCAFSFSEDWAGLAKTVIVQGAATRDIALLATNEIVVPAECVNKAQFPLKIGVYGALPDGTIAIPTIWASFGKVLPGAKPSDIPPDELTPDVVAQIQEAAGNALYLARNVQSMADSGELDGVSPAVTVTSITGGHNIKITDRDHPDGQDFDVPDGVDGTDGVSPAVSIESITGGHAVTITDADHPTGQTFNVMDGADGQDGQDATVDATLSNAGEAADAAETGKVKHTADYALRFAETLNNGNGIPLDAEWLSGDIGGSRPYRAHSKRATNTEQKVLQAAAGYRFYLRIYSNGSYSDSSWYGPAYASRLTYTLPKGADYILVVSTSPEDQSVTADPEAYGSQVTIKNNIGSGGGSITVDSALSDSSENPVQNKIIKAALDAKGTYTKPSGGIPSTDLASAVQTSLGKADTALQTAPVTSVNGQTGAVTVAEPYFVTYSTSDMTTWTCDKTFAQITAAMAAGMQVVFLVSVGGTPVSQSCDVLLSADGDVYCIELWTRYARNGWYRIIHNDDDSIEFYDAHIDSQDVDAVASDQGVSEAGKFLVVGNDGIVTTMTLATWQGGNY